MSYTMSNVWNCELQLGPASLLQPRVPVRLRTAAAGACVCTYPRPYSARGKKQFALELALTFRPYFVCDIYHKNHTGVL